MPLNLFPADRIAFQFDGPGRPIVVPAVTPFAIYLDAECTSVATVYDINGEVVTDGLVRTDATGLLEEFQVEDTIRVWALAQVLGSEPYPLDAAFGPRITELEGNQSGASIQHPNLLGLDGDDHPQYLNATRGDLRYPTIASVNSALAAKATNAALTVETNARVAADNALTTALGGKALTVHTHSIASVDGLQDALAAKASNAALTSETDAREQADSALDTRLDAVEARPIPDVTAGDLAGEAQARSDADAALATDLAGKSDIGHDHTSASISDFVEAVQDTLATFFNATGATFTYDDVNNQMVVDIPTGGGGAGDPELMRDTIGAALIGFGNITVTPNDGADTITITTTATVNSTDAALRDRATHTGSQGISTVTGLQAELDSKAPSEHQHTAAQITDSTTLGRTLIQAANAAAARAAIGAGTSSFSGQYGDLAGKPALGTAAATDATAYATAAQGGKADTATQPEDLALVATAGTYDSLTAKPTLGTAAATDSTAYATSAQGTKADSAVQPGDLSPVATSGAYGDLSGRPSLRTSIPFSDGRAALTVGAGDMLFANVLGKTVSILPVRVDVVTAPTGSPLVVDVLKNGVTIFTNPAKRPQIASGSTFDVSDLPDVTSFADGDTLTVDVVSVGSTTPGGKLTVIIVLEG